MLSLRLCISCRKFFSSSVVNSLLVSFFLANQIRSCRVSSLRSKRSRTTEELRNDFPQTGRAKIVSKLFCRTGTLATQGIACLSC